jgi:hypothetical protein
MMKFIALDVVRRAEKRFVFEIMRESGLVATSDEHKAAKGAARAGKPIWKRTVKANGGNNRLPKEPNVFRS